MREPGIVRYSVLRMSATLPDGRVGLILSTAETLGALPPSLKAVAERQLVASEPVLGAVYLVSFRDPPAVLSRSRSGGRLPRVPGRALIVTQARVLVLDDPADRASTSAAHQFVTAACPLDAIIGIELRSHLLDCAFTLVLAAPDGARRVTIGYNGVSEPDVVGAVHLIRRAMDLPERSASADSHEPVSAEQGDASRRALHGLSLRQRNYVRKYVPSPEQLRSLLAIPALPRGRSWRRFSLLAHEQPAALLARTDRQVLLVENAPRVLRRAASNGCDAWFMPVRSLSWAELRQGQSESTLAFGLGGAKACYTVEVAVPASLSQQAATFSRTIHSNVR